MTSQDTLFNQMARILVPESYLQDFEISSINELSTEWQIELTEKADRVPTELQGKECVLDGYCNSVDVLTHAFSLKKIYLRIRRRR